MHPISGGANVIYNRVTQSTTMRYISVANATTSLTCRSQILIAVRSFASRVATRVAEVDEMSKRAQARDIRQTLLLDKRKLKRRTNAGRSQTPVHRASRCIREMYARKTDAIFSSRSGKQRVFCYQSFHIHSVLFGFLRFSAAVGWTALRQGSRKACLVVLSDASWCSLVNNPRFTFFVTPPATVLVMHIGLVHRLPQRCGNSVIYHQQIRVHIICVRWLDVAGKATS